MNRNFFKKWEPIVGLPALIYFEGLHHDYEGFRLLLKGSSDQDKMLRVIFNSALVYSVMDEGDMLFVDRTIDSMALPTWPFYIVEDSSYLEWFSTLSQGIHSKEDIIHYSFFTPNECIDVLASTKPSIEWLN